MIFKAGDYEEINFSLGQQNNILTMYFHESDGLWALSPPLSQPALMCSPTELLFSADYLPQVKQSKTYSSITNNSITHNSITQQYHTTISHNSNTHNYHTIVTGIHKSTPTHNPSKAWSPDITPGERPVFRVMCARSALGWLCLDCYNSAIAHICDTQFKRTPSWPVVCADPL